MGVSEYTVHMNSIKMQNQPLPVAASSLPLPGGLASVRAGFPSPAEDLGGQRIDLSRVLITHPQATFLLRARGTSMVGAGIFDDDILVVNRALQPRHQSIVVAVVDGEFTVKTLYQRAGRVTLQAANPAYPDIVPEEGQTLEIWGVVTAAVHQFAH